MPPTVPSGVAAFNLRAAAAKAVILMVAAIGAMVALGTFAHLVSFELLFTVDKIHYMANLQLVNSLFI